MSSLAHLILDRFAASPWHVAYEVRAGAGWRTWTWREVEAVVRELSAGLLAVGVAPEARVAILAGTSLEWILADFAVLCARACTTTIYPSSTAEECRYILEDAEVVAVFAGDAAQVAKIRSVWAGLPGLAYVIALDGTGLEGDSRTLTLAGLRERGRAWLAERGETAWQAQARAAGPEDLATLIYTSGTTGRPKGVRLVHDCWLAQADALGPLVRDHRRADDKLFVWLPLAHAYGKVLELAGVAHDVPTAVDGDIDRLAESLAQTRPTYVPAVPRVFEKMHDRILGRVRARGERPYAVFQWASRVGIEASRLRRRGAPVPLGLRVQHAVADRLVFRRIREAFGGRIRAFLSGSAPLSDELQHFFDGAGMLVLEGYGLTECAAVATANAPDALRPGSVGKASDGMEVRISAAGEVQLRGRAVMRGYHGLAEATEQAFEDGWFRTGDLGELDGDGFLRITGRIKELIITSGGKNIAPARIESAVKARCPIVQEVVMVGDRRSFCTALVTLDAEAVGTWAAERGKPVDLPSLSGDPEVRAEISAAVAAVNATLASFETVKDFVVLDRELTLEAGELTPSQKVRRSVVVARYGSLLDRFYA
ncbi:MAG: long-chain fatty acid--CoA ligase [Myxococcota bacterium]